MLRETDATKQRALMREFEKYVLHDRFWPMAARCCVGDSKCYER
jgi:hypothetical protein